MPIGGASGIGNDENSPPVTESAGLGYARIQSVKTSLRQALDSEHNYPSAGGDNVGYHRMGSARPYYGTQSQVSSSGSDSRLMITSDTSRLFGVGSGGTSLLGAGPLALSIGSFVAVTFPQRSYLAMELGQGITSSSGSTLVTIPNSGYSGLPFLQLTSVVPGIAGVNALVQAVPIDGVTFVVNSYAPGSSSFLSGVTFHWQSIGSRAL